MIQTHAITKRFDRLQILKGINIEVHDREIVAIVGPSGAGKTTLLQIVGTLDRPDSGHVIIDGVDPFTLSERRMAAFRNQHIGFVFQFHRLLPEFTALENVMVAQYYHSMPDEKEALEALDRVGLADRATHLPRQLSGGEQQRVCVARALINYPKLLLADEPTGNLDETNEEIVLDLFNQLHQDGTTLMVVTHDALVAEQGQREIRLDHGKVVKETWHDHDFEERASGLVLPGRDGVARSGKDKVR